MSKIIPDNPTIKRWNPNFRYEDKKLIDYDLKGFTSTEKSLTDKEAFRVSLASLRGQLASGMGSPTVGSYSIKAGEEYDSRFDFSYLNRPDVSLVELHEFIENYKDKLDSYDSELRFKIENELKSAESKAKELEKAELAKAEKSGSEK